MPDPVQSRDASVPWEGRGERADWVLAGLLLFIALYGLIGLGFVPSLVGSHPALLALLRGSTTSIITLGALARTGHGSLVVGLLAGTVGCIMFDWLYWWAGRRWGERALALMLGSGALAERHSDRVRRLTARFGPAAVTIAYLLPVPTTIIDVAAGWGRMRLVVFLVFDALGAALWVALLLGLGYAIGQPAVDAARAVGHYALWVTLGLVAAAVAVRSVQLRRAARV